MATLGQPLTQPEEGWKRYDDKVLQSLGAYTGLWTFSSSASCYNSTQFYTSDLNSVIEFSFIGSKIRFLQTAILTYASALSILIDDVETIIDLNHDLGYQILTFEQTNLAFTQHTVKIQMKQGSYFDLDAIDIDANGSIMHQQEVSNIHELQVGKRIRCHYQSSANQVGIFSNLGEENYLDGKNDFIPVSSAAIPNGNFYFIHVGYDELGRKKMIADRNIQHSVPWSKINEVGMVQGNQCSFTGFSEASEGLTISNLGCIVASSTTQSTGYAIAKAMNAPKKTGKYYFEAKVDNLVANQVIGVGVGTKDSVSPGTSISNTTTQRLLMFDQTAKPYCVGPGNTIIHQDIVSKININDIIGIKIDMNANTLKFTVNSVDLGITMTNISELAEIIPIVIMTTVTAGSSISFNFDTKCKHKPSDYDYYDEIAEYMPTIRLATGGLTVADKNNEWEIIAESTLNNTIKAGDNDIWHWQGLYSFTATASLGGATRRVSRGYNSASSFNSDRYATLVYSDVGFRPMLITESLNLKALLKSNDQYYSFTQETGWTQLGVWNESFINNAITMQTINNNLYLLPQLENLSIVVFQNINKLTQLNKENKYNRIESITKVPLIMTELEKIKTLELNDTSLLLLKIDNKYYSWLNNVLTFVSDSEPTKDTFLASGFLDINTVDWTTITDTVEIYAYTTGEIIPILNAQYSKNVGCRIVKKG